MRRAIPFAVLVGLALLIAFSPHVFAVLLLGSVALAVLGLIASELFAA